MKRLISANASEILRMNAQELKQSIKASEGRVILSENVAQEKVLLEISLMQRLPELLGRI